MKLPVIDSPGGCRPSAPIYQCYVCAKQTSYSPHPPSKVTKHLLLYQTPFHNILQDHQNNLLCHQCSSPPLLDTLGKIDASSFVQPTEHFWYVYPIVHRSTRPYPILMPCQFKSTSSSEDHSAYKIPPSYPILNSLVASISIGIHRQQHSPWEEPRSTHQPSKTGYVPQYDQ